MCAANKLKRLLNYDTALSSFTGEFSSKSTSSPWAATEEQDAVYLQTRTFNPCRLVEPNWTKPEELTLEHAMMQLASGALQKPTEGMKTAHFLSHHVMDGRHSRSSCLRKLHEIRRRLGSAAPWEAVIDELNPAEAPDGDSGNDSDDEVPLSRPLGM